MFRGKVALNFGEELGGILPGGLYIEMSKKEDPQKEMTAAAMSSDIIWYTGLGLKSLGHQIAVLARLQKIERVESRL